MAKCPVVNRFQQIVCSDMSFMYFKVKKQNMYSLSYDFKTNIPKWHYGQQYHFKVSNN